MNMKQIPLIPIFKVYTLKNIINKLKFHYANILHIKTTQIYTLTWMNQIIVHTFSQNN